MTHRNKRKFKFRLESLSTDNTTNTNILDLSDLCHLKQFCFFLYVLIITLVFLYPCTFPFLPLCRSFSNFHSITGLVQRMLFIAEFSVACYIKPIHSISTKDYCLGQATSCSLLFQICSCCNRNTAVAVTGDHVAKLTTS